MEVRSGAVGARAVPEMLEMKVLYEFLVPEPQASGWRDVHEAC